MNNQILKFSLLTVILSVSEGSPGQSTPSIAVLPISQVGIVHERKTFAKPTLAKIEKQLITTFLKDPKPLLSFVEAAKVSSNMRKQLHTAQASSTSTASVLIQPLWCTAADYDVFFIQVADLSSDLLVLSDHRAIKTESWWTALKKVPKKQPVYKIDDAALLKLWEALASDVQKNLQGLITPPPRDDAFGLALNLAKENTRADTGSAQCLNMLMSENILKSKHTSMRFVGGENMQAVRHLLGISPPVAKLARPTRQILTKWEPAHIYKKKPALPLHFTLTAQFGEMVFGKSLNDPRSMTSDETLSVTGDRLALTLNPGLEQFCQAQESSLKFADAPQVAKVYGAWVYLDRGRAWGLKMHDRLLENSSQIKGHVIGFYGPEEKLNSPRGFPIQEGAIVYVRKNQRLSKVGQTFSYDPTTFPTTWPPASQAK